MSSIRHAARALLASDVAATPGRHRQALAITAMFTLLLRAMRWLSASTMLMVLANGLFAVSGVYLVARFSPFSLAQRWLYPLGFYPLYRYGLVALDTKVDRKPPKKHGNIPL